MTSNFEFLQVHINSFVEKQKLTNVKIKVSSGNVGVSNFLGSIYRVQLEGEKIDENKSLSYNLVIKCCPKESTVIFNELKVRNFYHHEICFYEEKIPVFNQLLSECGNNVKIEDIPIYYGCCKTKGDEVLILEDVSHRGFTAKKSQILDYAHAQIALQHLARFHAYGFILQAKNPELFEKTIKSIKETAFFEKEDYTKMYGNLCDVAIKAIESEGTYYVDKINNFRDNVFKSCLYVTNGFNAEPFATINHGDFWTNNMLFKYNENSEPVDFCCMDFQMHRYASPILDIVYMLFVCCTQEMRQIYYDRLLNDYYKSLAEFLCKFNLKVEQIFPFEIFMEHLQLFGNFGACMALFALDGFLKEKTQPIISVHTENCVNDLLKRLESNKFYASMLKGIFKDMIDKNYI
ncbi:uncharacterized protein LOC122500682 [Leptopilina heterotoma]|uniref:uncharacterized protein LOC122500682 n=1 Tax=Leptopilina heterotoma TaxID=63436 RepID=UPI001CA9B832|nr:uncharacterized protein LOC122500682 [Leptopilina heterotoma]